MKQPNPTLASLTNDELLTEMVARQHSLYSRMQAAIGLFQEPAAPTEPAAKAPKAKVAAPPVKTAAKQTRSKVSSAAPVTAKRPATNKSINEKPVHHYVLEAVRSAGGPVKPSQLVEKMVELGWKTSSNKPYSITYMNLQLLAKKGMVVLKDKMWMLGPNANTAPERSKPGRKKKEPVVAPISGADTNIDDPTAMLESMDPKPAPPAGEASAAGSAPPALREGESLMQSPNGTTVIRRAGRAETEAETP